MLRRKGGGIWGKSAELAWPLLSKQHPGYVWLLYFPWSKHKVVFFFFSQRRVGSPSGGKIKVWPLGLSSSWMGNILISPFDVFLRASVLCPSTQTSPSLSPELPVPRAYLLVTGASISRAPKHILHGINRENKVAHPFTGSFREAGALRGPWKFIYSFLSGKVLADRGFEAE